MKKLLSAIGLCVAFAVVACLDQPTTATTEQGLCILGGCDDLGCWPQIGDCGGGGGSPSGGGTCSTVCTPPEYGNRCAAGCGNNLAYCPDYLPSEYAYCRANPDSMMSPGHYCGPAGNPVWYVTCRIGDPG